jgi:hypothetical protein
MTQNEIDRIKKDGMTSRLFERIRSRMWDVRKASEDAVKDSGKDFLNQIRIAREALDDAEQLFAEKEKIDP